MHLLVNATWKATDVNATPTPPPPPHPFFTDPTFVHAHLIPDSAEKNDDKLYFFFREKASEMGQSPMTQSRIGRICLVSYHSGQQTLTLIIPAQRFRRLRNG